ncbi:MAG: DUF3800 domain-containing protein [Firmicutes bacterium]|nr:DUF3800 domain-containing protein [Bacillota bacterium]
MADTIKQAEEKNSTGEKSRKAGSEAKVKNKQENARRHLLKQIYTLDTRHLIAKVGFILNQFPETRDNDKLLTVEIYKTFYSDYLEDGDKIRLNDLLILPKSYEMQRYRAHIQNVLGLFKASPDVQKRRKVRRKEWREEEAIVLSPPVEVFTGESGSDSSHLVIGSLWIYDRLKNHSILKELRDFRESAKSVPSKFDRINQGNLPAAKEFLSIIMKYADVIGFEAHIFENYKEKVDSVHEAFLHHVLETIDSRIDKKIIELPKAISIIKNLEIADDGTMLEDIHKDMNRLLKGKYDETVFIDQLFSIETENSPLLQMTDFFTGALNQLYTRKRTSSGKSRDEFAVELCKALGIKTETLSPKRGNKKVSISII